MATLTALLITFFVAPWFIRRARARQLGEVIREDGPATHAAKSGTPTMGGALIILALVAATLLWCDLRSTLVWLTLLVTVGFGVIGFVDDYLKLSRKNKKGLPGKLKLLGQFVIGGVAVAWLFTSDALPVDVRLRLATPLLNFDRFPVLLPLGLYVAFGIFVLLAESNAVNLTDGLDGLAIGPVIICSFTFLLLAYAAGTTLRNFNIAEYLGMAPVPGRASWPSSAAPWAAPASGSCGSTPTLRKCSWATSARWRWAGRWDSWPWRPRPSCRCPSSAACSSWKWSATSSRSATTNARRSESS